MSGSIRQRFIVLLLVLLCFGRLLAAAKAIKGVSMNNQPCSIRPMLVDLNFDELIHNPFIIGMNRCGRSCSTTEDQFGRICIPNKMEDVNLKVFNMTKGINESKTLSKHILS